MEPCIFGWKSMKNTSEMRLGSSKILKCHPMRCKQGPRYPWRAAKVSPKTLKSAPGWPPWPPMGPLGATFTPHGSHVSSEIMVSESFLGEKQAARKEIWRNMLKKYDFWKPSKNLGFPMVLHSFSLMELCIFGWFLCKLHEKSMKYRFAHEISSKDDQKHWKLVKMSKDDASRRA